MLKVFLAIAFGVGIGFGARSLAIHDERGKGNVSRLSERDIIESMNGKAAKVTMVEVSYGPGESGEPHRHPGPIFGYVLEGEFELGLGDQAAKILKAGDTFYEPTGILHRVSRNPGAKTRTRVLAVLVHPREATQLTLPE